jgi:hypothetical protein
MDQKMLELIYFGMMPVIIFVISVLYHLDIDVMDIRNSHNGRELFGFVVLLMMWPLMIAVGGIGLILFVVVASINWLAKKMASAIKKGTAK